MTDDHRTLRFSPLAVKTLHAMSDHVLWLREHFGEDSSEHVRAAASLARSLVAMIGLGGEVTRDGDLSLYGVSDTGLHYGVNFSRSNRDDDPLLSQVGRRLRRRRQG